MLNVVCLVTRELLNKFTSQEQLKRGSPPSKPRCHLDLPALKDIGTVTPPPEHLPASQAFVGSNRNASKSKSVKYFYIIIYIV